MPILQLRAWVVVTLAVVAVGIETRPAGQAAGDRVASMAGLVVDGKGTPISRALVAITSVDLPGARTTVSDDQGRFAFDGLPAGRFSLAGSKPGFFDAEFGEQSPGGLGTAVRVAAGAHLTNLRLRLPRAASVAIRMVDADGTPVTSTFPTIRYRGVTAEMLAHSRSMALGFRGDGRGGFRIDRLPPGSYEVFASNGMSDVLTITVAEGDVRDDLVLRLRGDSRERLSAPLDGVVLGHDGRAMQDTQLRLMPLDTTGANPVSGPEPRVDANGRFSYQTVAAGRYRLNAHAAVFERRPGQPTTFLSYWASTEVTVTGHEPSTVTLALEPGVTVAGRITFSGTTLPVPNPLTSVGLQFLSQDPPDAVGATTSGNVDNGMHADGTFAIRGVPPGRYVIRLSASARLLDGWNLVSAMLNGVDAADIPLTVAGQDISGLEIQASDRLGRLEGMLKDAAGHPTSAGGVIAFPPDDRAWLPGARRVRAVRPDTSGEFAAAGLPAGEYLVAAVPLVDPLHWSEAASLARLRATATHVTIDTGASAASRLTLTVR